MMVDKVNIDDKLFRPRTWFQLLRANIGKLHGM